MTVPGGEVCVPCVYGRLPNGTLKPDLDPFGAVKCGPNGLYVDTGCGIDVVGGKLVWDRRWALASQVTSGTGTNPVVNTPTAQIINASTLSVTNPSSCGPGVLIVDVAVGSPGLVLDAGTNAIMEWLLGFNGGTAVRFSRVRLGHAASGPIELDWPQTSKRLMLPIAAGATVSVQVACTFQTTAFAANAGDMVSETGWSTQLAVAPDGV